MINRDLVLKAWQTVKGKVNNLQSWKTGRVNDFREEDKVHKKIREILPVFDTSKQFSNIELIKLKMEAEEKIERINSTIKEVDCSELAMSYCVRSEITIDWIIKWIDLKKEFEEWKQNNRSPTPIITEID